MDRVATMGRKSATGSYLVHAHPQGKWGQYQKNVDIGNSPKHCRLRVIVDQWNESCVVWNFWIFSRSVFYILFAITSWGRSRKTSELKFQIHGHACVEMQVYDSNADWNRVGVLASTISWGPGLLSPLACVSVLSPERYFSLSVECHRRDSFASSVLLWVWILLVFPCQALWVKTQKSQWPMGVVSYPKEVRMKSRLFWDFCSQSILPYSSPCLQPIGWTDCFATLSWQSVNWHSEQQYGAKTSRLLNESGP